jgi:Protein of unknown function (DUF3014)
MPDLDDYELERTRESEEGPELHPQPPERRRGLLFPALLALGSLAAVGALALLYFALRSPASPGVGTTPPPGPSLATPAPARPAPTPATSLPPLDESDDFVRHLADTLSRNPEIARFFANDGIVRLLTVVAVNVAAGESPRPHLLFLAPKQRFRARSRDGTLVPDPASFAGYEAIVDAVVSLDAEACAHAFEVAEPLFDTAFQDFGQPGVTFRAVLDRAAASLLAVPALGDDVELVSHASVLRYADPELERLTPAQKQLLRMGPRNVRHVQAKIREIAAALALPAARPTKAPSGR